MYRLRIFAGPNGSGKSSLYDQLLEGNFNLGYYLNPDDLHQRVRSSKTLALNDLGIAPKQSEWKSFVKKHGLADKAPLLIGSYIKDNTLIFAGTPKSYESAVLADFLRHQLLKTGETFSFETVFSHPSKLDFMRKANAEGYKCYLYFAAVASPDISVARVRQRAQQGGHGVAEGKVRKRYDRALDNLLEAIRLSYRAYIFDNSLNMKLIAEVTPTGLLHLKADYVPTWFQRSVLDKLNG